jgi:putative ABC transport system permease protein
MIKNYLTIALRNLSKHKLYSAINITGLAIGMAACIVISLFVYYERSFDNMHSKNI